jgi:hypothetical protein
MDFEDFAVLRDRMVTNGAESLLAIRRGQRSLPFLGAQVDHVRNMIKTGDALFGHDEQILNGDGLLLHSIHGVGQLLLEFL